MNSYICLANLQLTKRAALLLLLLSLAVRTGISVTKIATPPTDPQFTQEVDLFDEAVQCIKTHEGWHSSAKHYPYIGYGHRLKKNEHIATLDTISAHKLLQQDLRDKCRLFRQFGQDSLILGVLAYNIGEDDVLKSKLLSKLGTRHFRDSYLSFCRQNGKISKSIRKRRLLEYTLLYKQSKIRNDKKRNHY